MKLSKSISGRDCSDRKRWDNSEISFFGMMTLLLVFISSVHLANIRSDDLLTVSVMETSPFFRRLLTKASWRSLPLWYALQSTSAIAGRMTSRVWNMTTRVWNTTSRVWNMTTRVWNTTSRVWNMTTRVWNITSRVWNMTTRVWNITSRVWNMTTRVWNITSRVWNMTTRVWNITCRVWNVTKTGPFWGARKGVWL